MTLSIANVTGCNGSPAYIWYAINFSVFGIGLVILLLYTLAKRLFKSPIPQDPVDRQLSRLQFNYIRFHVFCEEIASACNVPGKMMIIILSIFNQISWTMDIYEVSIYVTKSQQNLLCAHTREKALIWIDFFINLYFLFHFIIRFIAASNKLRFWIRLSSLVDFMTVPSSLYAVATASENVVLNYIRAVRFITYTDALVYLGILTKNRHIRLSQLIFTFLAVWCAGAGLMHLLENTGDFWNEVTNAQPWSYWETNYFLLVTMSTVGYGDYFSKTILGRLFVCFFILTALVMFATFIPEILSIVSEAKISTATYNPTSGQSHVVVCGSFNPDTMKSFLKGFFHPDYQSTTKLVKMIVVCSERLDLETQAVFKQFNAWIHRFDGSVNSPISLEKIKLNESDGVIILSNLRPGDGDEEDNANIMRIVSLKISSPDTRIIVLLRHYRHKFLLHNFPLWKNTPHSPNLSLKPDQAVCMEELKMGLLAQNCLAPGASTLLVNLLINVAPEKKLDTWRNQFCYGCSMEIYGVAFSDQFDNIPFNEAAKICYKIWSIGLLAVDVLMNNGTRRVVINPSHSSDFVLKYQTMRAFILAADLHSANQLQNFCYECHYMNDSDQCNCDGEDAGTTLKMSYGSLDRKPKKRRKKLKKSTIEDSLLTFNSVRKHRRMNVKIARNVDEDDIELEKDEDDNALFDVTGTFHWCPSVKIDTITMSPKEAKQKKFTDHVVLCLPAKVACSHEMSIGLCNFVMPLRFHYIPYDSLKPIVILGSKSFIGSKEWSYIENFPKIYIVEGNPLNSAHLKASGIRACCHCVILSDDHNTSSEQSLVDKNAILCGMSAMQFMENSDIRTTIEIVDENNVHYFSTMSAFEQDCKLALQLTEPFSRGLVMSSSVLYSTLSSAYYSPEGLNFVLSLISGASIDIERMMGEGFGLVPEDPNKRTLRYGCHMTQLSMISPPFSEYYQSGINPPHFGDLFSWAMSKFGIFCLGLYRLRGELSIQESKMYFVFTFPPKDTIVLTSDKIFCLIPPTLSEITNLDTQDV